MKKRNLQSLKLNKKTISTLETSEVKGGSITSCTFTAYTYVIAYTAEQAAEAITEYFD